MDAGEIAGVLEFLRAAEKLKSTHRSAWTSAGQPESVAEHTWRLCLMALVLKDGFPGVDFARLVKMCIIHDLGEAIGGDIPATHQIPGQSKADQERADLLELLQPLPARLQDEITGLWDEYETAASPEAKLAKALDKLETIMQHNQGMNPPDFDYEFNLGYGKRYTSGDPLIEEIRALLDRDTAARAADSRAEP
ncbi:HD domain-containing protein [Longimicrobium sp.]|uniref:HD domain-containing protein n=1 Tax=Longimicrobium sp. TaxID=2029185 RepID=UPI003B3A314F